MSTFLFIEDDHEYSLKNEFAEKVPNYKELRVLDMFQSHRFMDYLHNETGPAIRNIKNGECQYIINGKRATEEEQARIIHGMHFNEKLNKEIKE